MTQTLSPSMAPARPGGMAFFNLCIALMAVSFAPIFIRFSETDLGPQATVLNRMLIFLIAFGLGRGMRQLWEIWSQPLTEHQKDDSQGAITPRQWTLLGLAGVASATTLGLWAISLVYTSVAKSMLLNNLTPVFACAGSWLFLGKRFDHRFLVGLAIAISGAILLGLEDLQGGATDSMLGDAYALLSAVFLGSYFLLVEQLRHRFDAVTILLSRCAIGSALLIPWVWMTEGQLFPATGVSLLAVLGLGIISEGIGQNLLADGMAKFSSSFITLFLLLEPIVSSILGWLFFAETITLTTGLGFGVILSGVYLAKSSDAAVQGKEAYTVSLSQGQSSGQGRKGTGEQHG
jgi:drug/metabolite transporter (DMT)-like permease